MTEVPEVHTHSGGGLPGLAGIKSAATHKIGPLPAIAWALIAVAAFYGIRYYRNKQAGTTSTVATGSAFGSGLAGSDGGDAGLAGSSDSGGGSSGGSGVTATNATWASAAVNWLIGTGVDGSTASNAMSDYLNGNTLSPSETILVNKVLAQFGPPPEGILPVKTTPVTPVKTPTPVPLPNPRPPTTPKPPGSVAKPLPAMTYYYVKSGDTLESISQRYYGNVNDWHKIANANHITDTRNVKVGTKLVIPK